MPPPPIQPRYVTRAASEHLNAALHLHPHPFCQDWEIELADADRVAEFLELYEGGELDDDQAFALMSLIVASYDDLLQLGRSDEQTWRRIRQHLVERFALHAYTVQYWSLPDEDDDPDHLFLTTPRMRDLMKTSCGPRDEWPREPVVVKRLLSVPVSRSGRSLILPPALVESLHADAQLTAEIIDERNNSGYRLGWSILGTNHRG